tara:strand:+ start:826 stop:1227 length:402 start_codon:yes stop_codon:yes gene_type:complete
MKKTLPKLKQELDKWFSQYIRLRRADANGLVECFTCSKKAHWKKQQAGHFMSRRYLSTRWNELNVQVQCVGCNMFKQGEQYKFGKLLDVRVADETSDRLERLSKATVKFMRCDYVEMIQDYKQRVKLLLEDCV